MQKVNKFRDVDVFNHDGGNHHGFITFSKTKWWRCKFWRHLVDYVYVIKKQNILEFYVYNKHADDDEDIPG